MVRSILNVNSLEVCNDRYFDLMPTVARPKALSKLFQTKTRSTLGKGFGAEFPGQGKIGLNIHRRDHALVNELPSAEIWQYGRVTVARVDIVRDELQPFAPLIARKHFIPLLADMIPSSSFGASLANILTSDSWREVRRQSFEEAGYNCQVCGEANGPVEGHELWSFTDQKRNATGWSVQKLERIICVCNECHEIFHPGLANVRGRSMSVAKRLCAVNDWSEKDYNLYARYATDIHVQRSKQKWMLDMSALQVSKPLVVKSDWTRHEEGVLSAATRYGRANTKILGVSYIFGGRDFFENTFSN